MTNNMMTPGHILRLAQSNVIVNEFVRHWERGTITWEQSLAGMVAYLVEREMAAAKSAQSMVTKTFVVETPCHVQAPDVPMVRNGSGTWRKARLGEQAMAFASHDAITNATSQTREEVDVDTPLVIVLDLPSGVTEEQFLKDADKPTWR